MSKQVIFIQYPKCSTCRTAAKWLNENGVDFVSRDITLNNPSEEELRHWIPLSKLPVKSFFNTSGRLYREMNLKERIKTSDDDELIAILSTNGMIVKRPLIISDKFVLVGFNEDEWSEKLK